MSPTPVRRRPAPLRWCAELALGMRLSVAGGRSGWARLVMISLGVGLGVAMLLGAATMPALTAARDARGAARTVNIGETVPRGADTMLVTQIRSEYQDRLIDGWLLQPEGDRAPLPPGVDRRLAPGEMAASPALARLMASGEGELLRERWGGRVVATIGEAGLSGPGEYYFYLGTDRLTEGPAERIRSFGSPGFPGSPLPLVLLLLAMVGLVAVLLPVGIFLAAAVRFGGEARDRQLAALRLVGADTAMTRRIAAGETLAGALLGVVAGGVFYGAAGLLASRFAPSDMSFYLADFRPVPALAALTVVLVPVVAVLVAVAALRRVEAGPLGVVRRGGDRRRRLWWRLVLPAAGLVLLYPLHAGLSGLTDRVVYQAMAGVAALLAGVTLLLPWLVEALVRRLGGGGVAWQLAVRRLQLDNGTAVRAVSGIAVSVAGAIALQGLLAAAQTQYTMDTGYDTDRFQAVVQPREEGNAPEGGWKAALGKTAGVNAVSSVGLVLPDPSGAPESIELQIGDCAGLRQFAEFGGCTDGDVFVITDPGTSVPRPGTVYTFDALSGSEAGTRWKLPAEARAVPSTAGGLRGRTSILVTPSALHGVRLDPVAVDFYVALDSSDPHALERVRNTAAQTDPSASVWTVQERAVDATLAKIRKWLLVGATALLLLIGASMLVNVVEQLRERRRPLAVLVAFGTPRTTLAGSVLYQVAIPVLLGLTLAVATGTGLAAILQTAAGTPVHFDWLGIGATSGTAALVILLTTAASLPLLWRLTHPGGLRSE